MATTVEVPLWLFILILLFAAVTFASHFLFPSVRWFFRRRLERVVARLNQRLERPIQPFKLARRYDMIQRLIYDPQVMQAVADHAHAEAIPENVAAEQARAYAREIVPSFSASAYFGVAIRLARFLSNALYRVRLGHYAGDRLKDIDPKATVIFVMNHRSNMDYVLVTYLAAERSALSYAVGEWAQVWPLSRLISAMGAYFIRRKSRNELYRRVLARYVQLATEAGVTQAMFPEGGLSRTGALLEPKLGLLKYILDGFDPAKRDVVFVPVGLNYDRVLEDRNLIAAANIPGHRFNTGLGVVTRNALRQLWLRVTGRYRRFGYAAVSFGAPLSLAGYEGLAAADAPEVLAAELMQRIGAIVPVLPVPAVCTLLLRHGPMSRGELETLFAALVDTLPGAHVHIPRDSEAYAAEYGLRLLLERRLVTEESGLVAPVEAEREVLVFYANSIRHLLPSGQAHFSAPAK
ncbi:1-acyl-sn-glycerol-3-phosphate acyltransferase [Seohaeicola zhoushanensis]|uniref:Glycerol-3-phosphate acyltransferase n=1 Tax=Seohaeicola zhoushanensis TaxID=1569283 RepID=A0A8J3H172_9RHOB|nr:1-acyl-sn-glycerol-3-phosphate acyltransferase [Seohaeicola zhoushanensis]GHF64136.1 glycerol-3-phosphate 1-O-acyltransferase [Seohaeicola zhoushanensis]